MKKSVGKPFRVRCTEEDYEFVKQKAKEKGCSISKYVKERILNYNPKIIVPEVHAEEFLEIMKKMLEDTKKEGERIKAICQKELLAEEDVAYFKEVLEKMLKNQQKIREASETIRLEYYEVIDGEKVLCE